MISTRQGAYKVRDIRRDPRVWLCALPGPVLRQRGCSFQGRGDRGTAGGRWNGLVDYYGAFSRRDPDWDDYRAAMVRDQRVLLRISVTKAGPNVSG